MKFLNFSKKELAGSENLSGDAGSNSLSSEESADNSGGSAASDILSSDDGDLRQTGGYIALATPVGGLADFKQEPAEVSLNISVS